MPPADVRVNAAWRCRSWLLKMPLPMNLSLSFQVSFPGLKSAQPTIKHPNLDRSLMRVIVSLSKAGLKRVSKRAQNLFSTAATFLFRDLKTDFTLDPQYSI